MNTTRFVGAFTALALTATMAAPLATSAQGLHLGTDIKAKQAIQLLKNEEKREKKQDKKQEKPQRQILLGTVLSVSGTDVKLKIANGSELLVHTAGAKLLRRFGGSMVFADIQVNDQLLVQGTTANGEMTAQIVHDQSLQAHNGTFTGTITAVVTTNNYITIQSNGRGAQQVNLTSDTKYFRDGQAITYGALVVGQTVRVTGVWDRTNSNVTASRVEITTPKVVVHVTGALTAKNGNQLNITSGSQAYLINSGSANLVNNQFEHINLNAVMVGDQLDLWTKGYTDATSSLKAYFVRDTSR